MRIPVYLTKVQQVNLTLLSNQRLSLDFSQGETNSPGDGRFFHEPSLQGAPYSSTTKRLAPWLAKNFAHEKSGLELLLCTREIPTFLRVLLIPLLSEPSPPLIVSKFPLAGSIYPSLAVPSPRIFASTVIIRYNSKLP